MSSFRVSNFFSDDLLSVKPTFLPEHFISMTNLQDVEIIEVGQNRSYKLELSIEHVS